MPTFDITANQSYPLPHADNDLEVDVGRLRSALSAIDTDIATILSGLSGKASIIHSHTISDVTGLQTALDLKLNASAISGAAATLLDDQSVAAMRTTLGLGNSALKNTGTNGNNVPLLDGINSWANLQTFHGGSVVVNGVPGTTRLLNFRSSGNARFSVGLDPTEESGQNAGSNYIVRRFNDGGVVVDDPITIDRNTGEVVLTKLRTTDFVFNHTTKVATVRTDGSAVTPGIQMHGNTPDFSTLGLFNWSSVDSFGLVLSRARGGAFGTHSPVTINDLLGSITFAGSAGGQFRRSALISVEAEAAAGSNFVQSRMRLYTTDSAGSMNELVRLDGYNNVRLFGGFAEALLRSNVGTGSTISPTSSVSVVLYDRSGTIANLTFRLPTTDVVNGQRMKLITRSAITSLSVTVESGAGASVFGDPSTLAAGGEVDFVYYSAGPYWVAGR